MKYVVFMLYVKFLGFLGQQIMVGLNLLVLFLKFFF